MRRRRLRPPMMRKRPVAADFASVELFALTAIAFLLIAAAFIPDRGLPVPAKPGA